MKKTLLCFTFILILCLIFTACNPFTVKSNGVGDVKFVASNKGATKSISTGDGANAIAFASLDGHKIKLKYSDGTGYCSLAGAKAGYVDWPESAVQLGYGEWTVYAQGYKGDTTYYENTTGVTFIVGPQGVSLDKGSTWGSSVSIAESYCGSADAQIKANTSLEVKDEVGTTVTLGLEDYSAYTVKWYKTTTVSPTELDEVRTISELTETGRGFEEWTTPSIAIDKGSNAYVAAVIVKSSNTDIIYGMAAVPLADLTAGSTYTIGSGSGDYVQFGKYSITFKHVENRGVYTIGEIDPTFDSLTSDFTLSTHEADSFTIEKKNGSFLIYFPEDLRTYYMSQYGAYPDSGNPFHTYCREQFNIMEERDFVAVLASREIELPKANYELANRWKHPSIVTDTDFSGTVTNVQGLDKEILDGYIRDYGTGTVHDFTGEENKVYLGISGNEKSYWLLIPDEASLYIASLDSTLSYNERVARYFNEYYSINILDQSGKISISAADVMTILAEYKAPVTQQ